ncbi:MAG: hypothetical protein ACRDYY_07230 [Acidimicrobiales bacterium]
MARRGAATVLSARLPDALVAVAGADPLQDPAAAEVPAAGAPWDAVVDVGALEPFPWALAAGLAVPPDVAAKRLGNARIAGWLPGAAPFVVIAGLDQEWAEAARSIPGAEVVGVDGVPGEWKAPAWATDIDRAAVCSSASLVFTGPEVPWPAAIAATSGRPAVVCGARPAWAVHLGAVPVDDPAGLVAAVAQATPGEVCPDLSSAFDRVAAEAAEAGQRRDPEGFAAWASAQAEEVDLLGRELSAVRRTRLRDRTTLAEVSHRLEFVERQQGHDEWARIQAQGELERLRSSPVLRWAARLPGRRR